MVQRLRCGCIRCPASLMPPLITLSTRTSLSLLKCLRFFVASLSPALALLRSCLFHCFLLSNVWLYLKSDQPHIPFIQCADLCSPNTEVQARRNTVNLLFMVQCLIFTSLWLVWFVTCSIINARKWKCHSKIYTALLFALLHEICIVSAHV